MSVIIQRPNCLPSEIIIQRPNRIKSELTAAKDAYQLAFEADPDVGTRAEWLAALSGDTNSHDLGALSGTVTLSRANGKIQHGFISGDTTFTAPGAAFAGAGLTLVIDYTVGTPDVNFTGIKMNPEALALLPITLAAGKAYQFEFSFLGGSWVLTATSGPFAQTISP